jgi:hypothetical protein
MRPKSIVLFERLVLLGIVLGIISAFLVREQVGEMLAAQGQGVGTSTVYIIQAITIALYLLLIWFISRHGSPVAKWIYVVLAGLGLVIGLLGIGQTLEFGIVPAIIAVVQYGISAVSIWLLFRPDAKAWFSEGRGGAS